jgi:hypothetical protein
VKKILLKIEGSAEDILAISVWNLAAKFCICLHISMSDIRMKRLRSSLSLSLSLSLSEAGKQAAAAA